MIVDFNKYIKGKNNKKMFTEITHEIHEKAKTSAQFSPEEIKRYAKRILSAINTPPNAYTPINRIAEGFGILTYQTDKINTIEENISGVIYVGGTTKKIYESDKVIIVDSNEPEKHQRFIIAHEIGHYLFDYLTDSRYDDGKLLFEKTYPKKNHDSPIEARADMFAAELLMPTEIFIKEYNFAMDEKNNRMFTLMYLSEFFQTKVTSIEKRIREVLQ